MKPQRIEMEWPAEKLQRALSMVIDEQSFSKLKKQTMKKKLLKQMRRGTLRVHDMETEWLHRLCRASLMLHDYHWFAWEYRSEWAMLLSTQDWVYPRWDGSKCKLLVVAEQGIGDEIVFSSCYDELAEDVEEAWIEVDPRLIPIFERSFPENLHFVNRFVHAGKYLIPRPTDYPEFHKGRPIEAFIMAGNVPKLYRHCVADFPKRTGWLIADKDQVFEWLDWLKLYDVPRIGCSWKGRQGEIEPIFEGVSLQYGTEDHKGLVNPPLDLKRDIDGVYALAAALNKVVTTTNAVIASRSIGVPTDVIKPPPIWATKEDAFNNRVSSWWPEDWTDWYPSIKMHRSQTEWKNRRA